MIPEEPAVKAEKKKVNFIPKEDKPKKEKIEIREVEVELPERPISDGERQMNPSEAVAWAMTQPDPWKAVKRLVREQRLSNNTQTFELLKQKEQELL